MNESCSNGNPSVPIAIDYIRPGPHESISRKSPKLVDEVVGFCEQWHWIIGRCADAAGEWGIP